MKLKHHMMRFTKLAQMLLVALVLGISFNITAASPAYAQQGSQSMSSECKKFEGIVNRFGSCIKETVMKVAVKYFDKMYSYFLTALNAFLTFGVIIYGVMLAAGMVDNVKRDSIVVLLKVAFVAFFCANLEMIYFWVIDMMDGLIDLYFTFTTSQDQGQCQSQGQGWGPFKRLDCLLDLVIGLKGDKYNGTYTQKLSGEGVGRGFINFFFKAGITGSVGMIIAGIGFFIVWTLIMTVIKITLMYLLAIIALTFIVMIGPLFIPLVIFKQTKQYFDSWLRLLVSFGLQPVIMFAYVAMMIIAFDKAVFSNNNSLMSAIAGQSASSGSGFNLNQHIAQATTRDGYGAESKAGDSTRDLQGQRIGNESVMPGTVMRDIPMQQQNSGGSAQAGGGGNSVKTMANQVPLNMIDWKKLAEKAGKTEAEHKKEIFFAVLYVALVIYVFTTMLNYIPTVASDMTGGYGNSLFNMVGQNPLQAAGGKMAGDLQSGLQRMLGGGNQGQRAGGRS